MVEARGNLKEILADLSITIKAIHAQFQNMDPVTAHVFKKAITAGIVEEDGPVWGGMPLEFVGMGFSVSGPKDGG